MLIAMVLLASAKLGEADRRALRMTALYDQLCLRTFPDDKGVEASMKARGARELSRDEVRITMRDDPARGWDLDDGGATLWIELPPFHTCSVRWNTPEIGQLQTYRDIAVRYEQATGQFEPMSPWSDDQGDIHIHAIGESRRFPDRSTENLLIFDQSIRDPARRRAGETGYVLRFVHQFAPPPPDGAD